MPRKHPFYRRSQRYTGPEFRPYVIALGQLALAWNELQASFSDLFALLNLTGPPQEGDAFSRTPHNIWNAIRSDRTQREILRSLLTDDLPAKWNRPKIIECIEEALKHGDSIEIARNDALHSPLIYWESPIIKGWKEKVAPVHWLGHPRAKALMQRSNPSMLGEIRLYRDRAIALSDHVREITQALTNPPMPWPNKLRLPSRPDQERALARRIHKSKGLPRQRRSSQEKL